jgi:hypothetical protein
MQIGGMTDLYQASCRVIASSFCVLAFACAEAPSESLAMCTGVGAIDPALPVTRFDVHLEAGSRPLVLGEVLDSAVFDRALRPSKARFYVSELALLREDGSLAEAELVDERGERLPYELALIDGEHPSTLALHVRAEPGTYRGLALSVGVPERCTSGERLNHADASALNAPLDVDSDMYWSWNSGYVFVKFEGHIDDGGAYRPFFYHVGGDERLASLELEGAFSIPEGVSEHHADLAIAADFRRLFASEGEAMRPDPTSASDRRVHGGELANHLARNLRGAGFLRLAAAEH